MAYGWCDLCNEELTYAEDQRGQELCTDCTRLEKIRVSDSYGKDTQT